ncbi:FliM/FliN family flagellar motor switch protein [Phaeovulum sp. W22_SRMD_FR3]|uniref:FliM/FliN family flagellar motor switch protein n=1 Tax=Phaeovulum sp. W22_SRMD_FR3 TaxID=3240274 RepID=UPI003F98B602
MTQERLQTVLRRKAEAGKPAPVAAAVTPPRALGQALAKTAQDLMGLPLRVANIDQSRMSLADLPEALEDRALLAMLEGPGEALGLVVMPQSTYSALIEFQTMGRLSAAVPAPRKPTRTDASLSAEFIDAFLTLFEADLVALEDITWAGGFRYASYLDDPRPLGLLLEDVSYRVMKVEMALGAGGDRMGNLMLVLPAQGRGPGPKALRKAAAAAPEARGSGFGNDLPDMGEEPSDEVVWSEKMESTILGTTATLDGVLHRVTLPLSAVLGWVPGTVLPVPMAALEGLRIEGSGGRLLGHARLGQNQGFRAMRICGAGEDQAPVMGEDPYALGSVADAMGRGASPMAAPMDLEMDMAAPMNFGGLSDEPAEMGGLADLGNFGEMGDLPPMSMDMGSFGEEDELPPLKMGGAF